MSAYDHKSELATVLNNIFAIKIVSALFCLPSSHLLSIPEDL